ncbi:hypothetical protein SprV_0401497600 [Sparganum proliferum]
MRPRTTAIMRYAPAAVRTRSATKDTSLMAFLQTLGGNTARYFVKRQLRSLFANSLLPEFNLNGRYSKRNFRQTNTFKMLQNVYRGWSTGRPLTLLYIEKSVRSTLKSAVTAASVRRRRQNDPE